MLLELAQYLLTIVYTEEVDEVAGVFDVFEAVFQGILLEITKEDLFFVSC